MNKVNARAYCIRPILAAGFALAIAFTFSACSSGDDGVGGDTGKSAFFACRNTKNEPTGDYCWEVYRDTYDLEFLKEECIEEGGSVIPSAQCPKGSKLTCEFKDEDFEWMLFFYSNKFKNCEEAFK